MRDGTHAHRRLSDDVDDDVKQRRLREVGQMAAFVFVVTCGCCVRVFSFTVQHAAGDHDILRNGKRIE